MCLVFALVAAVAALRATPAVAQVGPDETAKFLKTVEGTVKAIGESRDAGIDALMRKRGFPVPAAAEPAAAKSK